jgi:hypothetical protein
MEEKIEFLVVDVSKLVCSVVFHKTIVIKNVISFEVVCAQYR